MNYFKNELKITKTEPTDVVEHTVVWNNAYTVLVNSVRRIAILDQSEVAISIDTKNRESLRKSCWTENQFSFECLLP